MPRWSYPTLAVPSDTPDTLRGVLREFMGDWSPRILILTTLTAWATRLWLGDFSRFDAAIVVSLWVAWPLQEWLIHVYILHAKPFRVLGITINFLNAQKHRAHHRDPWRMNLIFVPLFSVLPAIPILLILALVAFPTPALGMTFFSTYILFALYYEWVHSISHTRWGIRAKPWTAIVRAHQAHHFKSEHHWLGVSRVLADKLLGTAPDPKEVPRSATVRTLGVEP